jgi:hypothetical protein
MEETGPGRSTIFLVIKGGRLKAKKTERRTIVLHAELMRFLEVLPDRAVG